MARRSQLRTLAELYREHGAETGLLVKGALSLCGWRLGEAAHTLAVHETQLRRLIDQHGLREEYARRNPGRGRPRTVRDVDGKGR
jgi:predicted ArsR family transcriptional regulator